MKYLRGHGIITMQIYYPPSISFAVSTFAISIDINESRYAASLKIKMSAGFYRFIARGDLSAR